MFIYKMINTDSLFLAQIPIDREAKIQDKKSLQLYL